MSEVEPESGSSTAIPAPARPAAKTKEEALEACVYEHKALVDCFRTCRFMGLCCKEEHKAFWDCFARERGSDQTKITSTINRWLGNR